MSGNVCVVGGAGFGWIRCAQSILMSLRAILVAVLQWLQGDAGQPRQIVIVCGFDGRQASFYGGLPLFS